MRKISCRTLVKILFYMVLLSHEVLDENHNNTSPLKYCRTEKKVDMLLLYFKDILFRWLLFFVSCFYWNNRNYLSKRTWNRDVNTSIYTDSKTIWPRGYICDNSFNVFYSIHVYRSILKGSIHTGKYTSYNSFTIFYYSIHFIFTMDRVWETNAWKHFRPYSLYTLFLL